MPPVPDAPSPAEIKERVRAEARAQGFDLCGFAPPDLPGRTREAYRAYIQAGRHGDMAWLARDPERRETPKGLWPDVRSVVVLGMNYGPDEDPRAAQADPATGAVSVYARGRDYHDVVKKRLKRLARWMHGELNAGVKVFVDTAPVLEKPLAQAGGIGWQGKHSNLVSRDLGSWFFLGEVFTDLELPPDPREADHCGSCAACVSACPTDAFVGPYRLDARRCLSYLTIEHKGHIPREFRRAMGNRVYGCDDCLAACPWNKFARVASESMLHARNSSEDLALADLARLDDASFRAKFTGSPVKRLGRDRFLRNVLIALGNAGDRATTDAVLAKLADESPLVRATAVWALALLVSREEIEALAGGRRPGEADPDVQAEWDAALAPGDDRRFC